MRNKKVTIFTSTYNRGHIITNLYKSLLNQTNKDFEWIIYDDGSTDNTRKIIYEFIEEKLIDIKYVFFKNRGKHVAINYGVEQAEGELFFIVDSDDMLIMNAIDNIISWWNQINEKSKFIGVAGLKINLDYPNSSIDLGTEFIDATSIEFQKKYPRIVEKAEIFKTDLLKKYKFPYFKGENFIAESVIWNKIADDGYLIRWVNKKIYEYRYEDDGLTRNFYKKRLENINGTCYTYNMLSSYKTMPTREKVLYKINYFRYGLNKKGIKELFLGLKSRNFLVLAVSLGFFFNILDKIRKKNFKEIN